MDVHGLTDPTAATQLGLSPRTLHRRLRRLMDLAGVRTRMQLGGHAVRHGWVETRSARPAPTRPDVA
ncbi:helix-turn-helix domain-containing protein [Streptomyces sp. NPDC050422]|uniref:helix-turn-helix domain-containing protein n=1 Tax=Streptomyces sp. NPDC050422 TaxID=3365614 RepID=UPI0037BB682F